MHSSPRDPLRLLLVEDSDADARRILAMLRGVQGGRIVATRAADAAAACEALAQREFELVLLDLGLPDSQGPDTVRRVAERAREVPIVVLTWTDDDRVGVACIQAGAQDYLPKSELRVSLLGRVIGYAIARASDARARRKLEREMLEADERERQRAARNLHEVLAQQLTGIAILARSLAGRLAESGRPEADDVRELGALIEVTIAQSVALARGLDPLTECGEELRTALEGLANGSERRFQIRCRIRSHGVVPDVTGEVATQLHWIAQEALTNAVMHGEAGTVDIEIGDADGALELVVSDDGKGVPDLDLLERGQGLRVMEYRARSIGATHTIERNPSGSGLRVRCRLPSPAATRDGT